MKRALNEENPAGFGLRSEIVAHYFRAAKKTTMEQLIVDFPKHIEKAIEIGCTFKPAANGTTIQNVVISGLGGSGIGGTMAAELFAAHCRVPMVVNKEYGIPSFINQHTLFIASSYSGNTEETISATRLALAAGAVVVVVSSGGELVKMADQLGLGCIVIPGGQPPRASFGLSFPQILFVLKAYNLIDGEVVAELRSTINLLGRLQNSVKEEAKMVTEMLFGKLPVIYAAAGSEAVAVRFRQQVNENSKMLCWHHVIPEMNHNELVGWRTENQHLAVVLFRNKHDHPRIQARIDLNKEVFAQYTSTIIEIWSKGEQPLERALYLVHLGDWISLYLGQKKGIDITEVKVIDALKGALAKL